MIVLVPIHFGWQVDGKSHISVRSDEHRAQEAGAVSWHRLRALKKGKGGEQVKKKTFINI